MEDLSRTKIALVGNGTAGKWLAEEIGKIPCAVSKWCRNSVQPVFKH